MYIHRDYPKWKYHPSKEACIVGSADAEASLGDGWVDSPALLESVMVAPEEVIEEIKEIIEQPKKRGKKS